jgi:hypothetical protein
MYSGIEKHEIGSFEGSEHSHLDNVPRGCITRPFNSAKQEFDATAPVTSKIQNLSCDAHEFPRALGRILTAKI